MPDFDRILFEGDFNPIDFNKGIDSMIESLRKAQAQGDVSSATLDKMQGAIDGVTVAATNLQAATGKPLAPSLSDGKLVNALGDIRSKAEETAITIEKLKVANIQLAQETKELTSEYSKNSKEIAKLTALQKAALNTSSDSFKLNETRIKALTDRNVQLTGAIADNRNVLTQSNTAIKNYTKSIATAAPEHNKLSAAVERLTSVQDIAAKGVTKLERIISFGLEAAVIGLALEIGGPLIKALLDWSESATAGGRASLQFQESIKENNDILEKSVGTFSDTTASFSKLTEDVDLAKRGFLDKNEVLKEYNTTMGLTTGQLTNFDDIEKKIIQDGPDYIKLLFLKAQATAAYALAGEAAKKALTAQATAEEDFGKIDFVATNKLNLLKGAFGSYAGALASAGQNAADQIAKNADKIAKAQQKAFDDLTKKGNDLEQQAAALANFRGFDFFGGTEDAGKIKKEREDDFEKRKADFIEQISKLAASEFESELTIRKQYDDKLDKALADIGRDDTITSAEDAKLRTLARQLNSAELDKAIADFHKKVVDEQKKISDELAALNIQIATARVANIQDDFERERITIETQSAATTEKLKQERDKQIKAIQDEALKVQFPSGFVNQKITEINQAYASLLDQLEVTKNARLNKLAFDTFEKLSENAKRVLDSQNLGTSELSLIDINKLAKLFAEGKISYEQFQRDLTKISKRESDTRLQDELINLRAQVNANRQELVVNNDKLTEDEKTKLLDKIRSLEGQITELEKKQTTGEVTPEKDSSVAKRISELNKWAIALNGILQQVGSFWQAVNDQEEKSLERSIAIQDRRVTAAQQIAAKGNAEYLRLEEERQQQLLLKQEANAKRQMGINAALQASQLLVAITGAIASAVAATGPGAPFVIAGDIAAIIGALAAGYTLVKSLSNNQPTFFVGTEDTGAPGDVDNKGGKHAIIHPHERIITAADNKHLKGITNKQLIETINQHKVMVDTWKTPPLPQLNYAAMDMATNVSATQNVRLASIMEDNNRELKENNMLQRMAIKAIRGMGVESITLDQNGFSATVRKVNEAYMKSLKL